MALRSTAANSARRTRTSSNGFFLLLMAKMVLAFEPPIRTANLGSALNCARLRAAATRGNASTSPDSSEATCAEGSLMKRITTLLSLIAAALRYSGHLFSVIDEPLAQAATVYGPVPTGLVPLVATLFGSTIEAGACPSRNGRFGSGFFILITTVSASGVAISAMLWNRLLSLLVLVGAADLSNENFTVSAFSGSPFWNLTPLRSLKV